MHWDMTLSHLLGRGPRSRGGMRDDLCHMKALYVLLDGCVVPRVLKVDVVVQLFVKCLIAGSASWEIFILVQCNTLHIVQVVEYPSTTPGLCRILYGGKELITTRDALTSLVVHD